MSTAQQRLIFAVLFVIFAITFKEFAAKKHGEGMKEGSSGDKETQSENKNTTVSGKQNGKDKNEKKSQDDDKDIGFGSAASGDENPSEVTSGEDSLPDERNIHTTASSGGKTPTRKPSDKATTKGGSKDEGNPREMGGPGKKATAKPSEKVGKNNKKKVTISDSKKEKESKGEKPTEKTKEEGTSLKETSNKNTTQRENPTGESKPQGDKTKPGKDEGASEEPSVGTSEGEKEKKEKEKKEREEKEKKEKEEREKKEKEEKEKKEREEKEKKEREEKENKEREEKEKKEKEEKEKKEKEEREKKEKKEEEEKKKKEKEEKEKKEKEERERKEKEKKEKEEKENKEKGKDDEEKDDEEEDDEEEDDEEEDDEKDDDPDDCANSPCVNGQCTDGVNSYRCKCNLGYEGENCETNINDCANSSCVNGQCTDGVNSYQCKCNPGYEGENCETNINDCTNSSCGVNGQCIDGVNSYQCKCNPGYEGENCETSKANTQIQDKEKDKKKEAAFATLSDLADNIDARNDAQIQNGMASFKTILSDDQSMIPKKKIEEAIMAVKLIEAIGRKIASQLKPTESKADSVGQINGEQVFAVSSLKGRKPEFTFPDMVENLKNISSFPARVQLPSSVLNDTTSGKLSLVFMIYKASGEMDLQTGAGNEDLGVAGQVVLVSLDPRPKFKFDKPVVITIRNNMLINPPQNSSNNSVCVYLMENTTSQNNSQFGIWSNHGCELAYSNSSHSICHCYHLTNFAILTRFSPKKIPSEHELALGLITYIGLSLSILGCLITLLVHLMLPKLWTDRSFIHMNLVIALGIANIVFLFQKLPDVNTTGCTVLTFVLLYFYLSAFSWMLLEGIHIYRMLIKVFESGRDPRKYYFVIGWGLPLVLVAITAGIFRNEATSDYYCWLSATNGALWMFAGPVCLVILINTFMLLVVLKTSYHHSKHEKTLRRSMAKTFCVLLPVLGLTWLIGIITFNKDIIEMQYIFAILNSLQGFFIFIFYVVYSTEVRKEISQKISVWKTEQEINDRAQITRETKLSRYSDQYTYSNSNSSVNTQPPGKAW